MRVITVFFLIVKTLFWIFIAFVTFAFAGWGGIHGIGEILETVAPLFLLLLSGLALVGIARKTSWGFVMAGSSGVLDIVAIVLQASKSYNVYSAGGWLLTAFVITANTVFLGIVRKGYLTSAKSQENLARGNES